STVVDNTLMVVLAMTYALEKLEFQATDHKNICQYFVNGDDLLLAVNPEYESILDSFQELFSQLGLKYTFGNRTRDKGDLWFMSHKGVKRGEIYIPKLEEERIVSILEWDRSTKPEHRLEAICAAMVESWGYEWLTKEIRQFYSWVLEQAPYNEIAKEGKAPYISEMALRQLYTSEQVTEQEIVSFLMRFEELELDDEEDFRVYHQGDKDKMDAGLPLVKSKEKKEEESNDSTISANQNPESSNSLVPTNRDRDIDAGTRGTYSVPKLKAINNKMRVPKFKNKNSMNLEFLLTYSPEQCDITNTRATQAQYESWYEGIKQDYGVSDAEMEIILSGLMVWCLENGSSPNLNGMWTMMDGSEQREFPVKPLIDHAKPTFRQIMHHFSDVAVAYIEMRNMTKPYMPGYGLKRNLRDRSLACYAFDFYEMTSRSPERAREAHLQMKAAALKNSRTKLFGLDGSVSTNEEDTERHTVADVNRNMHSLLGMQGM
ncbi:polyprotein, partial [Potyvirus angelicae]